MPRSGQPEPRPGATSVVTTGGLREEPRGLERYLTDLMRSPAQPLLGQLVELLLAPPPVAASRPGKAKSPAR